MHGVEVLAEVAVRWPDVLRILVVPDKVSRCGGHHGRVVSAVISRNSALDIERLMNFAVMRCLWQPHRHEHEHEVEVEAS
jgi:hypothetical protein